MSFNSLEFAIFLPIAFLLYWFVFDYALKRTKYQLLAQNIFVLIASYIFYAWWNWRFLILIAFTSFCSWLSGRLIGIWKPAKPIRAKITMIINVVLNLSILGIFKYYNFFVLSFIHLFNLSYDIPLLKIILPVGISFYTFQAISYSIDVYREKIQPTKDIIAFFAFVSFFPQLVAGPIERATNLLPQFLQKRKFDSSLSIDGMRQMLWGLFKKIVVADNCAVYVNNVFDTYQSQSGSTLALAAVLFSFQIYCDFSGYSDIAIGSSKLFGIRLKRNFHVPYFSRDIAEFWRRWHISLNSWFVDYVYIPLGGSRPEIPSRCTNPQLYKKMIVIRNTFIIFLISGLWHGANWTYVAWGAFHAIIFVPLIVTGHNKRFTNSANLKDLPRIVLTFALATIGWIIFRSSSIVDCWQYMTQMFSKSILTMPWLMTRSFYLPTILSIVFMLVIEWISRDKDHPLQFHIKNGFLRWMFYYALVIAIFELQPSEDIQFIYFQF